ncbi:MAG: hypothetical protein WKF66_13715 [Pedobacter sp.]
METLEPKLESLLMSKTFEALNAEERLFVSAFLTEESYNAYHLVLKHTLRGAHDYDETLLPAAEIPAKLKAHFYATRKPAVGFSLRTRQLSIAACLVFVVSLGLIFFNADKSDKAQVIPVQAKNNLTNVRPEPKDKPVAISKKPMERRLVTYVRTSPKTKVAKKIMLIENTDSIVVPQKFYGLYVQEPLLGLDIDVNDQLLGLQTPVTPY